MTTIKTIQQLLIGVRHIKTHLGYDEWYPVYSFTDWDSDLEVEVSEELYNKVEKLEHDFMAMQNMLSDLHQEAKQAKLLKDSIEKGK